jgi:ABC-type uncharacterized transport system ATPase component
MNIPNSGLLNPVPTEPDGYVTKDLQWAAVPFGKRFVIIHNGEQVSLVNSIKTAKNYINKQIKAFKKTESSLTNFLK